MKGRPGSTDPPWPTDPAEGEQAQALQAQAAGLDTDTHVIQLDVRDREAVEAAVQEGAVIIGANCGNGSAGMTEIVKEIRQVDEKVPVLVHANAGLPVYEDGKTVFPESPGEMAAQIQGLIDAGANIIGVCCGTTPEHIRLISGIILEANS